jgi:putative nucleotidyltransferase with HDIG domain
MAETRSIAPTNADLKNWLRVYVRIVAAGGAVVVIDSLLTLRRTPHPYEWLLFAALAVLTGSFSMKIPMPSWRVGSVSASITVSDTFFITTALLFGSAPATLAVALSSFVVSCLRRHSRDRVIFNAATTALGMWAGTHLFFGLPGIPPLTQVQTPAELLIIPLLGLTSVYFLTNSGLIAVAIGLDARRSPIVVWRQHFLWLSVNCFAAASVSFCLVLLNYRSSLGAAIVILPLLVVLHLTLRSSFGRLEDARTHLAHLDRLYLSTVETLAMAIDAKDDVTHSHVRRVQAYALGLAQALGVNDEPTLKGIEAAALLHDTGKLAVPEHILNKPGKLSVAEFEQMKRHVDIGADILSLVDFPYPVVPIVRCHHENWDGSGYPRGIKGTDIPIGARILSVVDCFDALTSDRPYRSALTDDQAFEILRSRSGNMYEPLVVDAFIRVHRELVSGMVETTAHRDVLRQISQSVVSSAPPPAAPPVSPLSDDVLAFARLARLAAGEGSIGDTLAVASLLLADVASNATIAWYLVDESSGCLVLTDAAGAAARDLAGMTLRIGDGLSGWVAAHRQVISNSEAFLDLGERARHASPPLRSCLSAPLITRDSLVGTLTLYTGEQAGFTEDQSRVVQIIAPHVAQAIWTAQRSVAHTQPPTAVAPKPPASTTPELRLVATR